MAYCGIENVPVSLSIVPFAAYLHGDIAPYHNIEQRIGEYPPVHENEELINYIKDNERRFEVLLHGIHHEYRKKGEEWIPEMLTLSEDEIREELLNSRKYMERLFSREIQTFIAPSDWMDERTFAVLDELGLNTMCILSKKIDHPISKEYIFYYIMRNVLRLCGVKNVGVKKYRNHKELECFPVLDEGKMWSNYLLCKRSNQPYVVYTHYWELNLYPEMKTSLIRIVNKMLEDGAKAAFVSECFE